MNVSVGSSSMWKGTAASGRRSSASARCSWPSRCTVVGRRHRRIGGGRRRVAADDGAASERQRRSAAHIEEERDQAPRPPDHSGRERRRQTAGRAVRGRDLRLRRRHLAVRRREPALVQAGARHHRSDRERARDPVGRTEGRHEGRDGGRPRALVQSSESTPEATEPERTSTAMMRWIVGSSLKFRFVVVFAAAALLVFGAGQPRHSPVDVFPSSRSRRSRSRRSRWD